MKALALTIAVALSIALLSCGRLQPPTPERDVEDRPTQIAEDGFQSSSTCKACHPSEYGSWHASYHRTMTQVAAPETVRPDFNGAQINVAGQGPLVLDRQDGGFWAEFDDPDARGANGTARRIRRQVLMLTGSHNQQVFWYGSGYSRLIGQLPALYLLGERQWIPRTAAFMQPPSDSHQSETGLWNEICINCHTTHGKHKFAAPPASRPLDRQRAETTVAEFGIACEACHGPGETHTRVNRNPLRRYLLHLSGEADPTTVLPMRLNAARSSEVCGQCHGIWEFYNESSAQRANSEGFPYRPGDTLSSSRFVTQPTTNRQAPTMNRMLARYEGYLRDAFWDDGMVRVSGREYNGLIDSPCFKNAHDETRTMSCSSCHSMHPREGDQRPLADWADTHQLSPGMEGNRACLACHPKLGGNVEAHTHHSSNSAGSACYNCHMPYTTYGLLKAIRSHQVSSPTVSSSIQTGRPNACNLCHLDKTLGWTASALQTWYGVQPVPLDADQQRIAASLLWLLRGDAGQRALVAWSMSWVPAQQASRVTWMAPYLSQLLDDPYDAVRLIARRSLRSLPGFGGFDYDFQAPSDQRRTSIEEAIQVWRRTGPSDPAGVDKALLINPDRTLNHAEIARLGAQRDDRPVNLRE